MIVDLLPDEVEWIRNTIELEYELWDSSSFKDKNDEEEQDRFFKNLAEKLGGEI